MEDPSLTMQASPEHDSSCQSEHMDEDEMDLDSSSPIGVEDDDTPIHEDSQNYSSRELRRRQNGAQPTTWLDTDASGNYDPSEERRVGRTRVKPIARSRHRNDEERKKDPVEISKLMVSLMFKTVEGRKEFTDIHSKVKAQDTADHAGYKLRTRLQDEKTNTFSRDIDLTAKPFARGCWACATLTAFSGEPACSLVHDERQWPCHACEEDGVDCNMIQHPARKRPCEQCKRRKIACSYNYTRNHGDCCLQCKEIEQPCVAGPAVQFIKPRIRLDRDWEIDPLPTKKKGKLRAADDCYECAQASRPCRYECEDDGSPCEACKENGDPCMIGQGPPSQTTLLPRSKKRKRSIEEKAKPSKKRQDSVIHDAGSDSIRETTDPVGDPPETLRGANRCNPHAINAASRRRRTENPTSVMPNGLPFPSPSQRNQHYPAQQPPVQQLRRGRGHVRKISTNFCHPMQFNCDEDGAGEPVQDCHFCDESTRHIAIFGLGKARPTVISFEDGGQYVELHGGHKALGKECTRLCSLCTTERLDILHCGRHAMKPIPETDYSDEVIEQAMSELCQGNMVGLHAYCALCANLAQYECQATADGCGLRLCEGCAFTLEENHGSNLQHMLAKVNAEPSANAPIGLRADAELLVAKNNCLNRFLQSVN